VAWRHWAFGDRRSLEKPCSNHAATLCHIPKAWRPELRLKITRYESIPLYRRQIWVYLFSKVKYYSQDWFNDPQPVSFAFGSHSNRHPCPWTLTHFHGYCLSNDARFLGLLQSVLCLDFVLFRRNVLPPSSGWLNQDHVSNTTNALHGVRTQETVIVNRIFVKYVRWFMRVGIEFLNTIYLNFLLQSVTVEQF
jgi:hypothetical protein